MNIEIKKMEEKYLAEAIEIWNSVVEEKNAFPQETTLGYEEGRAFFASQTYCGVAVDKDTEMIYGIYILHPNNVGRCGHICNASYAVHSKYRGLHIGEKMVLDCIAKGKEYGFGILQFNAVVESNVHARNLYERLGFTALGTIPKGFRNGNGDYENIIVFYHEL